MAFELSFTNMRGEPGTDDFPVWATLEFHASYVPGVGISLTNIAEFPPTWTFSLSGTPRMSVFNHMLIGGYEIWNGEWTFELHPFRCPQLDRYGGSAANIASVKANLNLSHFAGTVEQLHAEISMDEYLTVPPGAFGFIEEFNSDDGHLWVDNWFQYLTEPSSLGLTLGLFGCRFVSGSWEMVPLGGGDDHTFAALNDDSINQNVVIDLTYFCRAYLANKNNFQFFVWVVTPSTAQGLVTAINPDDANQVAAALWAMLSRGSMSFENHGYIVGHTGDPDFAINLLEGDITTMEFEYGTRVWAG